MRIILHRGSGPIGLAIKWQTRSPYSHAALLFRDGIIIEAHAGTGVHRTRYEITDRMDVFQIPCSENEVRFFAEQQVGKRYDFGSIARFVTRSQASRTDSGKWFCSELVFAAIQKAGINLLERIEPWAVSPGLLAHSPLLEPAPYV